jgi:tetratricopeptide (TPR) repeat protein
MNWEALLQLSETYEQQDQYKLAAEFAEQALEAMPENVDPANRGTQAVRAVNLRLQARQRKQARQLAQFWLDRNSLPDSYVRELRNLVTGITNQRTSSEARRRSKNSGGSSPVVDPTMNPTEPIAPTNTSILDEVASRILALPEIELQRQCARALEASIRLDIEHDPPRPTSPSQIATDIGVPISLQRRLGICLRKEDAFEFLNRLRVAPQRNFFRRLTNSTYAKFFGRRVSGDGGKPYVFTYAEILHFEKIETQIQLPPNLESLLN